MRCPRTIRDGRRVADEGGLDKLFLLFIVFVESGDEENVKLCQRSFFGEVLSLHLLLISKNARQRWEVALARAIPTVYRVRDSVEFLACFLGRRKHAGSIARPADIGAGFTVLSHRFSFFFR